VGGHSHSRLEQPEKVNGVIIAQAGSYTHTLGRIDLAIAGDTVQSYSGKLISPLAEGIQAQPKLQALIDSFAVMIETEYGAVIGELKEDWRRTYRSESNVGNWLTDALRRATGADIAFINSGGIRKDISAGPITKKDIYEMLPFQNYLETFKVTGAELRAIIQENANAEGLETHGTLQLSGVSYSFRKDNETVIVSELMVDGVPVDDSKVYTIASLDYVNANCDKYLGIKPRELHNTGKILADVIIEAIVDAHIVESPAEKRITRLN